jgi:hypothetical protein
MFSSRAFLAIAVIGSQAGFLSSLPLWMTRGASQPDAPKDRRRRHPGQAKRDPGSQKAKRFICTIPDKASRFRDNEVRRE